MECPVCKNEFDEYTGRKPKKFCSDACKVKFWNTQKSFDKIKKEMAKAEPHQKINTWVDSNLNEIPEHKEPPKGTSVTVKLIPPMPTRNEGEDAFDFAARKNEWKRNYNK